jgi:hypothetical protein
LQILKEDSFGALSNTVIPERFNEAFEKAIPENWLDVIKGYPRKVSVEV